MRKKFFEWLTAKLFPQKSKWIDVSIYAPGVEVYGVVGGFHELIQMRYDLSTNRKEFRTIRTGIPATHVSGAEKVLTLNAK